MLTIAGSAVALGDALYIHRAQAHGSVVALGANTATVRVTIPSGGTRDYVVEQGGMVAGRREAFWQAPIQLDLGKVDAARQAKAQLVIGTLMTVL